MPPKVLVRGGLRFNASPTGRLFKWSSGVVVRPKTRWKKDETTTTGWLASRTTPLDVPGLRSNSSQATRAFALAGAVARGPVSDAEPMDIRPDEVTIQASVEACWQFEGPRDMGRIPS